MPVLDPKGLIAARVDAIRRYHQDAGITRAELDLSGGIDSATMAGLLVLALGAENLTLVYSSINSGSETQQRAEELADALGVRLVVHDLTETYESMVRDMVENLVKSGYDRDEINSTISSDNTVLGSIRSCLRAPLGRGYLRLTGNGIRHGTGNECEDRWLRFYQKGGDGEVDSNPICMLSKGEVYQLALALGARLNAQASFRATIDAHPTPELWGADVSHTDEDEIGSYLRLQDTGHTFYSYINVDTGQYRSTGLIERVCRFADTPAGAPLFDDHATEADLAVMTEHAERSPAFVGVADEVVAALLAAARRTERVTRHKFNPGCPAIGNREELVALGILTDELPTGGAHERSSQ